MAIDKDMDAAPKLGSGKKMMDFRPSNGLAAGLKRVSGRNGTSRLGKLPEKAEHGKLRISHKY